MKRLLFGPVVRGNYNNDNRRNVNLGNNDNNRPSNSLEMTPSCSRTCVDLMKTYKHLFERMWSHENLLEAVRKAKKGKSKKSYVIEFEANLENELLKLQQELSSKTYLPSPLTTFIVRDPKTRKISASHFRDRVVHHALCNIISPIFESRFIHDTYANRKGKGTLAALKRFDLFLRKVTRNGADVRGKENRIVGYALKIDIKHYFENVDHQILLSILRRRICDEGVIDLIKTILANHKTGTPGKGMPLGNLTSQFFANVYLGELDNFVKHELKAKYYLRYVDDFVILGRDGRELEGIGNRVNSFLIDSLKIEMHPEKSRVIPLRNGVTFLGFRIFHRYRLLKRSNQKRIEKRILKFQDKLTKGEITTDRIRNSMAGWSGYAKMANTHRLRQRITQSVELILNKHNPCQNLIPLTSPPDPASVSLQ